jgi:putative oxidoreductase
MFPTGLPGLALLFLRASVAFAVVVETYAHAQTTAAWLKIAAVLIAAALSAGYLTPIAAAMAIAYEMLLWSGLGPGDSAQAIIVSLDSLALALLGPGAYSIDCYLFGRRVVVLPPPP